MRCCCPPALSRSLIGVFLDIALPAGKVVRFAADRPVVVRPWLKPDGSLNEPFLWSLKEKLLTVIARCPGIFESVLSDQMQPALSPCHVLEVLEMMALDRLIYVRPVLVSEPSLFGSAAATRTCYFPEPTCFSSFAAMQPAC